MKKLGSIPLTLTVAYACFLGGPSTARSQALTDRLRRIAAVNAPIIIHETLKNQSLPIYGPVTQNHEAYNQLLKVDFDGDNVGANNTANVDAGYVVDGRPTVYYSITESGTGSDNGAFFIGYYFYHPRDGGQQIHTPLWDFVGAGHQHDMEGVWLIAEKSTYFPNGIVDLALTEAHGALIPYADGFFIPLDIGLTVGPNRAPFAGKINKWGDPQGLSRAVVAIRRSTHGTYMAQDRYSPDYWDHGYGITAIRQSTDPYTAWLHDEANAIFYWPEPYPCLPSAGCSTYRLGPTFNNGASYYDLVNIDESPVWQLRAVDNGLYIGSLLSLGWGQSGYNNFFPSGVLNGETSYANPMWAWQGGSGEYKNIFGAHEYWYSFGVDNTQNYFEGIPWPSIPFGALLTDPIFVQNTYFPPANGFPSWNQNMLFNPFRGSALPPPPPQLIASVGGPTQISGCEINQWQAVVTSGTPPYTYSWSGDVSGTGQYVEGSSQTDMLIALDVWDATGQHAAPALYVHVSGGFC